MTSASVLGIEGYPVTVEVDIAAGLPLFATVGLPDAAVKESRDRVVAAVRNSGFDFPNRRITVNLAPADIKKEGAAFDLPIAAGILAAAGEIRHDGLGRYCFLGELSLDGGLRPVRGVLPAVLNLRRHGIHKVILPAPNAYEAAAIQGLEVYPAGTLAQVVRFLNGEETIAPYPPLIYAEENDGAGSLFDFSDVKGNLFAKRALEVAAAGGHNVIMVGSPGSGKTMLAQRLPTILPPLTFDESIEVTKIFSVAGLLAPGKGLVRQRPFRSPHHTVSDIALIGGGTVPRPGEVSLAHNGVLFLDEVTEFHRDVLEVLRQPLEDKIITIARAKTSIVLPSSFMLVAAMNPCPCGNLGHPERECRCTPFQVQKYRGRISGPLLDRIDIHLDIPPLKVAELTEGDAPGETSAAVRDRVNRARDIQGRRFAGTGVHTNAAMSSRQVKKFCRLDEQGKTLLRGAIERLGLSGRGYDKILKVSRTIADLAGSESIQTDHLGEAIQYRSREWD